MILTAAKSGEVAERIREAVEGALAARNVSARRASMDVVGHDGLIRDIRAGRIPSVDRIEALFAYLGLEAYFGPKRPPDRPVELQVISNHDPDQDAPAGFLTIPWHEGRPGSGSAPVAFSRTWLDRHQLIPDFLQAVVPDSFAIPAAPDPDTVALLDTRLAGRDGPGLWCYRDAGRVTVTHMTFRGGMSAIHPATPDGEVRMFKDTSTLALGLIGKVVWLGQVVPLKGNI